jgi:hypothetical protein
MDENVSNPIYDFYIYSYLFFFKKLVRGHFLGMVTSGDNVTHENFMEMRNLNPDETPFLLAMPQRSTTLAWRPSAGSFIPLDSHGHNRLARDETPYPLTRSCFIIFMGPYVSC